MDSQPPGVTATRDADASTRDAKVPCDQAVFTSVRTPMGEGYHLIAASAGLTSEEKTEITKRSPSHNGLCGAGDQAAAVAFYALPTGRLCAAWSYPAGREHSGRGGLRVYTRVAVFNDASLSAFVYNPFNVFRAMEVCGLGTPELKPDKTLPVLPLPAKHTKREDETTAGIRRVGLDWLSYILTNVGPRPTVGPAFQPVERSPDAGQWVILAGDDDLRCVIEAALLGAPGPLRKNVSFACGLKFSIGRAFTLTGITGDTSATERLIRGHPFVLLHPSADTPPPPFERCEWQQMVAEHWREAASCELQDFTSQEFSDCSFAALERIARLRNDTNRASVSGAAELLELVHRRLEPRPTDEVEDRLLDDLLGTIRLRLEAIWSNATETELTDAWPALVALTRKSPLAFGHTIPLAGLVLRRLASTSPATALRLGLQIGGQETVRAIGSDLQAVMDAVERRLPQADDAECQAATKLLERWREAFPGLGDTLVVTPH